MTTDHTALGVASVVAMARADREGAKREHDDAVGELEAAIRRGALFLECYPLFELVRRTESCWRDESADAVARAVGAYLMEHGHGEAWRALYPILLAELDIWCGLKIQGYAIGDEVAFVRDAGWWAKDRAEGNH